ncbi:MAG: glutamate synthase large subunit, partial [Alphaproteobacteria bacterium]
MSQFITDWQANAAHLGRYGLYDPAEEHEACGVGLVAAIDGKPRRQVVEAGIEALKSVWHRGAVDADGKTGDGAGIHIEIPQGFFREHVTRTGHVVGGGRLAVGMVFLPKTDLGAQETCRGIVETEILNFGYQIYGWRQVPVDVSVIGEKANATRPEIEQIMIASHASYDDQGEGDEDQFELDLYIIRRRIERRVLDAHINDFYICSLSCRSVIYKGMFLAEQVAAFYPDLMDQRFESSFAIYHQRYSTNTFPTWRLAQPFRMLAHNGEFNTIKGNTNWMKSHETRAVSEVFDEYNDEIFPLIEPDASDSMALDSVVEALVHAGRPMPAAQCMVVPESWSHRPHMPQAHRDFFAYCNCVIEPWDGPAALAASDGRWVIASMDRNGLRPLRYSVTADGLLIVGSESGMVPIDEADVMEKGRLGPGQMIGVQLEEGRFYHDRELKDMLAARHPYSEWVKKIVEIDSIIGSEKEPVIYDAEELRHRQSLFGYTMEELELILHPMVEDSKEPTGSMGDDTPLAVLSRQHRGLHHFFRQNFSQVTNPPIDSLREYGVMSLKTRLGNLGNMFGESESQTDLLMLNSPVLTNSEFDAMRRYMGDKAAWIDCTFEAGESHNELTDAMDRIRREAEDAVRGGAVHLVLSDENTAPDRAPVPMILAAGGVHSHLVRQKLRTFTSINVRSGECLDVHYFAVLIGVGATSVNAYLAQESIAERQARGLFGNLSLNECCQRYRAAVDAGLLKILSKMGISVLGSYRGAYNFEAVGLSRALVSEFFPGMSSRVSGIGLSGIKERVLKLHYKAHQGTPTTLPVGGLYKSRNSGEVHAFEGRLIHMLQHALASDSFATYKKYSAGVKDMPPVHLRDLMDVKSFGDAVGLEEVESITEIRKRFMSGSMSHGALSREAHETLAIAMNRIGAASCSGEGGEDPSRYKPRPNGDNASSAVKQIASGRFGVTAEYLNSCREIEIKMAQGAKPGEGGQLPGFKVSEEIARLRYATEGVTLISPPPHHDIYSIEDLAQLIYDLKQINPQARVSVKLVAEAGIGTISAGVAKAKADIILISGHDGGTGAAPQSSLKFAGVPWEMSLAEINQVLTLNRLRHTTTLRVDGGIKTGRDVVIAAMLGAEEFGVGTASLVAMGCILVRQCHSNICPVGICTQDETLRAKFEGTPEKVVNLFSFIAEEVREILASLGARTLNEIVGRSDLLRQVSRGSRDLDDLDLNPILVQADPGGFARTSTREGRNEVPDSLDEQMIRDADDALEVPEKMQLAYTVRNTHRAIGAKLSSHLTRRFGMTGLPPDYFTVRMRGAAGQSLGAFAVQGLKLQVIGEANDYVGKGLSGGTIVLRLATSSPLISNENAIIGNTVLYGATAGKLFAAGQAGERFCVRNSGARAVVEGCGSNGCEYMTG